MIKGLDNYVQLEPIKHQYFDKDGFQYISASKFLSLFKEPFNKSVAYNCAGKGDYAGMTPEEVLAYWEDYGKERADIGTNIHEAAELYSETTTILPQNEYLRPALMNICGQYKDYYRAYNEVCLYDVDNRIAGTSDRILVHTSHKDSCISISDYKTNERGLPQIDLDKNGKEKIKFLKGPLSHIIDSKYNGYCLQLNLYSYMLTKLTGRRIGKLFIHYINPNNPLINYHIPVAPMKLEIEAMIHWYKNNAVTMDQPATKSVLKNFGVKDEFDL